MVSIEQLYKDYEVLAEAGAEAGKHEKSYASILSAVGGDSPQKQLAGQFIPKFFKYFPSLEEQAINAQLDLCEDDVSMIRRQAIKELPNLCRNSAEHLLRIADVLTQLLQSDDLPEVNIVRSALMALYNIDAKGTLGGVFNQILSGDDKVRDRAIKFLSNKIQTLPPDRIPKEVEEFIVEKSKEVLADVTGEEFVIFMKLLTGLSHMQSLVGRKQLLDLVTEQADLSSDFQHADSDSVDRLIQCIRQAMPFFSKNVHSTAFLSYICERVLPNISSLASAPDENGAAAEGEEKKDKEKVSNSGGAKLEMLKLLAEMAANCGDLESEPHTANLFSTLVEYMPLPPPAESEDSENTPASEGPQLQFSYVECLMYTFHQLARRHPEFLTSEEEIVAERLKDFRLRLQYFARGVQLYKRQLRLDLQGKTGDQLKTDENKLKVVALRITSNIDILTKDLFHNPPSYKSTVILSWRPVHKQPPSEPKEQPGQKRSNITPISFPEGSTPAKKKTQTQNRGGGGGQRRSNRGMYTPPGGKYSQKAGSAPGGGDANYGDNYGGNEGYQNQKGRGGYGRNRGRGRGRYY